MADMLPVGMALAAAAAAAFEGGYLIQAREARREERLLRNPRWLAGGGLAGAGAVLQLVALHFAPLTVVQPVLALGVVALVLVGGRVFGEPAGRGDIVATLALAGGVALLTIAGSGLGTGHVHPVLAGTALGSLGAIALVALRATAPGALVAGAGAADALIALCSVRFVDALDPVSLAAAGWFAIGVSAIAASLSVEMRAVRAWPVTRVGPFVLVIQTVVPVLLAPIVAGEDWSRDAPLVLAGLALVAAGAAWLARSVGLLKGWEPLAQDADRGR